MKKLLFVCFVALMSTSCGSVLLTNSATEDKPVTAVFADLDVSPTKITKFYRPTTTVLNGGYKNVLNTAIREALLENGDADVLVGLETQVKYTKKGKVESITITGYPAKYVNFRSPGDDYLSKKPADNGGSMLGGLGGLKLGKK